MNTDPEAHRRAVEQALIAARRDRIADEPIHLDAHGQPAQPFPMQAANNRAKSVDQFIGICRGILIDGIVTDDEARALFAYCRRTMQREQGWPFTDLLRRLEPIFSDGVISDEERTELRAIVESVGGTSFDTPDDTISASLPLDDPPPTIEFSNQEFCITGRCAYGARSAVQDAITSLGGHCAANVCSYVHYLVIGQFASRDWIHTSYGRKIEAAVDLRAKQRKAGAHRPIAIISESTLRPYLL